MTFHTETQSEDKPVSKLSFFFNTYICSTTTPLFLFMILPLTVLIILFPILCFGWTLSTEIINNYNLRLVQVNVTNPINNITQIMFVKKCIDTTTTMICLEDLNIGAIFAYSLSTLFFLAVLYSYMILIVWLGICIVDIFKYAFCNNKFHGVPLDGVPLDGDAQDVSSCDSSENDPSCIKFCGFLCGLDARGRLPQKKCDNDIRSCFRNRNLCVFTIAYWIIIMYSTYGFAMFHILYWTEGHYDFYNSECTGKFGLCNTTDHRYPNKTLIEYFLLEILIPLAIEVAILLCVCLIMLVCYMRYHFVEIYEKEVNVHKKVKTDDV